MNLSWRRVSYCSAILLSSALSLLICIPAKSQWSNTSPNIYNTNTGNVGINTTSPQSLLDVNGIASAKGFAVSNQSDNIIRSVQGGNIYHLIATYQGWDPTAVYIAGCNAGNVSSTNYPSSTQNVYIGNPYFSSKFLAVNLMTGNVGIGTTDTKSYLFAVNGPAIFTKAVVKLYVNWPDFVFKKDYQLPSLDSVSQYIQNHSRLPDMPSADSVAKNGLDLGANQAAMLKKIEELTLYIINQNKEIKAQQEKIDRLERLIEKREN